MLWVFGSRAATLVNVVRPPLRERVLRDPFGVVVAVGCGYGCGCLFSHDFCLFVVPPVLRF